MNEKNEQMNACSLSFKLKLFPMNAKAKKEQ